MFLNAVVLVLKEILEASLLISVMLVLDVVLRRLWANNLFLPSNWLLVAIIAGLCGASLYAWATPEVSTWFDFAGYEVINAVLQFCTILLILGFCFLLNPRNSRFSGLRNTLITMCVVWVVAFGIIREGSEVILYGSGIIGQQQNIVPVLLGGLTAAGIGISSSWFLFHGLIMLAWPISFRSAMALLALFAGNMASQAVMLLTQANWLPYSVELWDSSGLLSEASMTGQVLFALVGYEATPSLIQIGVYLAVVVTIMCSPLFRMAWRNTRHQIIV